MTATVQSKPSAVPTAPAHPTLRVYNTLSKRKEPFATVQPGKVGIYLCGPTVYDKAHIGHMVGPVIFDCIKRYLKYCGYDVNWVVNITDVDDKLIKKASERGFSMLQLAEERKARSLAEHARMVAEHERMLEEQKRTRAEQERTLAEEARLAEQRAREAAEQSLREESDARARERAAAAAEIQRLKEELAQARGERR